MGLLAYRSVEVPGRWCRLVDHAWICRCPVGHDLDWRRAVPQRASEERLCGGGIPAGGNQDVDHLAVMVDRAVQMGSAAGYLDIGLVHEPTDHSCSAESAGRRR
jgi:hypothetical protein